MFVRWWAAWREEFVWKVEVDCSAVPDSVVAVEGGVVKPVEFEVVNGRVVFSFFSAAVKTVFRLEGCVKELVVEADGADVPDGKMVRLPASEGSNSLWVWVPLCDFSRLEFSLYGASGGQLTVCGTEATPFWWVEPEVEWQVFDGVRLPALGVRLTYLDGTQFLASADTNTWENILGSSFRVVVSGVSGLQLSVLAGRVIPQRFFECSYYYDFGS